jgi:hypothetical protein
VYWWNTDTDETSWLAPVEQQTGEAQRVEERAAAGKVEEAQLGFLELAELLHGTPPPYLSKVVEPYRETAFSDAFTDHLTGIVQSVEASADERRRAETLRARLANPLIRQPPPFL